MPLKDPDARRAYRREYQRLWYRKNRAVHLERVTRVNRRVREAAKQYVDEAKKRPCADCGGRFPPYMMDFDHVGGDKVANVSRFRTGRLKWAKLVAEIEKCEVVCANCHRRRTYLRELGLNPTASSVVSWVASEYDMVVLY